MTELYDSKIKPTASRYEKEKNNFERQIAIMDYYDTFYGDYRDNDKLKKFAINYDLANGRLDTTLYNVTDEYYINQERITLNRGEIPHIPIIAQVVKTLVGEQLMRPWKLSVEDESPLKDSIETEEYRKLFKQYIQENVIAPIEKEAMEALSQQIQSMDKSLLSQEDLKKIEQEMQSQIQSEISFNTPKEIIEYMENDFQNPIARQAQEIINHLDKKFNIKALEVEGFMHMLPTAEEFYYVNIGERGLEFDMVPPDSFVFGGPEEEEWVQKMDWAKRERWTTITDIRHKYSEVLKPEHIKELDRYYEPKFGSKHYDDPHNARTKRYMFELSRDPEGIQERFGNQDPRLKENFGNIAAAYHYIQRRWGSDTNLSEFAIRETHFVWKDDRLMYRVYRLEEGKIKRYYFDEHYVPTEDDLEVKKIHVPEVWEGTKIGTEDPIYLNIRPLQGQYKSHENPFDVELPYIGKRYNTFKGRSRNVSIIDLMKQFQRDYDTEMAALRKDLASNIGKVFVMLMNSKPQNMTWSDMLNIAKDHNLLLIDPVQKGMNGVDPQFMREVNMSKMSEIAERISLLREIMNNLYSVAGFNQHRTGQGGQYANATNIQTQQQASYNQTEPMFETHRMIVEKACDRLMNLARIYYKENPDELRNILSPTSYQELQFGYPFWYSYFNIKLENSGKVARQVEFLKQYMQAFIQNGMEPRDIIHLALAESKNDLLDILSKIDQRQKQAAQDAQAQQMEQFEQQVALQQQQLQAEREFKLIMQKNDLEARSQRSEIDAQKFRLASDVDADGKSDLLEAKMLELEQRAKEHEDKMELARQKQEETKVSANI